ncbi:hypothetical protein SAMN05444413_105140 [Roseivivax marinus]|uniref:hypothetical protein n=1 Tax=Roseivivax marinus TaxID=1379903 RepID=UPI0008CE9162|nr:hypothetical protein [Roseivivax marinus]SEL04894.1 hypothetical protein SAMN05444413_105140 [Roseivivax marinus]
MTNRTFAFAAAGLLGLGATAASAQTSGYEDLTCAQFRGLSTQQQGEVLGGAPNIAAVNQYCDANTEGMVADAMADGMESGTEIGGAMETTTDTDDETALEERETYTDGDIGAGTVASDPVSSDQGTGTATTGTATGTTSQPVSPGSVGSDNVASPESELEGADTGD